MYVCMYLVYIHFPNFLKRCCSQNTFTFHTNNDLSQEGETKKKAIRLFTNNDKKIFLVVINIISLV